MANPTAPGWYDDPDNPEQLRYFDGVVWSQHTTPRVTRQAQPPQQTAAPGETWRHEAGQAPGQWRQPGGQWQSPPPGQWQQPGAPGQWQAPPMNTPRVTGPGTHDGQALATYLERVGALIIDVLLVGILNAILAGWFVMKAMGPLMDAMARVIANPSDQAALDELSGISVDYQWLVPAVLITVAVRTAYQVFFLTRSGATPGKKAIGISVRDLGRPGPLSVGQALRRQAIAIGTALLGLVPYVGNLGTLVSLLDVLFPLWDPQRQSLHDKIAGTVVVKGPQPPHGSEAVQSPIH
ncbi:RDD family protein [Actinomycetota bacterium]